MSGVISVIEHPKSDESTARVRESDLKYLARMFSEPTNERDFRNRALFLIIDRTGLSAREVVALRFSDLTTDENGREVLKYTGKGGRPGFANAEEEALRAVREYHEFAGIESDYFFHSLPNRARGGTRTLLSTRGLRLIVNNWNVRTSAGRPVNPRALRRTVLGRNRPENTETQPDQDFPEASPPVVRPA